MRNRLREYGDDVDFLFPQSEAALTLGLDNQHDEDEGFASMVEDTNV
jgi:hypothetical protein